MTKIITKNPVALESPDHLFPWGTAYDNNTSDGFISEVENYFSNKKISYLDIGCSGGQLAVDFLNRGHFSVGIEGSNYSLLNGRANWPTYYDKCLFTCDASKKYSIVDDEGNQIKFDCITAWEVVEHIYPEDLDTFFSNIVDHMHENSIFVGGISLVSDFHTCNGAYEKPVEFHHSVFPREKWVNEILPKHFKVEEYPFNHKVREEHTSFYIKLMKK